MQNDEGNAEHELRISEERHRLLAEHANDVIWTMSVAGEITYVSPAIETMRGFTPQEAMIQSIDQIHPPESAARSLGYYQRLYELLAAGEPPEQFRGELEYYCKDGSTVWTEVQVIPHMEDGVMVEILGVTRDIDARKKQEEELQRARDDTATAMLALEKANSELARLATLDALTGAWNRRHLEQAVEAEIARAIRTGRPLTMLMLDLDRFKAINDAHGHLVGDQVLVEAVERLKRNLRPTDVLARWGGEEFVILMPECPLPEARAAADRLRQAIGSDPFDGVGDVTTSVGIAEHVTGESFDDWLRRTDEALYEAKASGRDAVRADPLRP